MPDRNAIRYLALGLVLIAGAACAPIPPANPTQPAATTPATAAPTLPVATTPATAAPTLPVAPTPATGAVTPTGTATTAPTATPTPAAGATATSTPTETPGPITANSNNIFEVILRGNNAPAGWTVQPCEGAGPFLCVQEGQEAVGAAQMSMYPVETMTDFQGMLEDAGLPRTGLDLSDPDQWSKVAAALEEFVEAYHTVIQTDRQVEYGTSVSYERLANERIPGGVPWLKYGFRGVNADGSTFERWVSYVGYDGDLMYILVAPYRPGSIPTFRSDDELVEFVPHLDALVAGLRVPLPVGETDVTSVRALKALDIFRAYSAEAGNPVGQVAAGETVAVTGVSPTGRHWRIACPQPEQRACWIGGTAGETEPAAR